MVQIRVMRMLVSHRLMLMPMRVRFGNPAVVVMLVMSVVNVTVLVRKRFVQMFVLVPFGEMEPQPESHQQPRESQLERQRLAESQRDERADKRRQRKVSAGASGPEMTKGQHEKNQADPDHEKSEQGRQSCDTDR